MDNADRLNLIERHLRKDGEKQADYARRVFDVTRQTLDLWRKGKSISANSQSLIDSLYDKARQWEADSGRSDDDHRRRALAAINLLEGRSLKTLADLGVALSTAQEFGGDRARGAALAAEAIARLTQQIQTPPQTQVTAG